MRRRTLLALVALASLSCVAPHTAHGEYGYSGTAGYGIHPYYDHWRPWWGGIGGWGPKHGCSSYPAYRGAPTSGYTFRPCRFPPRSNTYAYDLNPAGYSQYPRTFVYNWSRRDGDEAPQPRTDAPPPQPYQAP